MYGLVFGAAASLLAITWFIGYHVYAYFKDPKGLRRFPGMDPLAPFTNASMIVTAYGGFRSKHLLDLHNKGQPVIRTGPNALSYGDPRAIKDIYGHNTKCVKDEQYAMTAGSHFHLADVVDKHEHQRKRKVLSSAYALKNLEEWEFKVADKAQRMLDQLDKRCCDHGHDEIVDYRKFANFFSLDAIADIGLSKRLGFLDNADDRCLSMASDGSTHYCQYRQCLYANSRLMSVLGNTYRWFPHLCSLSRHFFPEFARLWKLSDSWDGIPPALTYERLQRYQNGERLDDFFQAMMHDKNGAPHNLEFGEIAAEVSIMMNAGSTTTAIAMTNTLYLLLANRKCLAKLQEELDETLDEEDVVAPYEKVKYLPYLRACLDESMRIWPPTSHPLLRATPPEGSNILGEYIPGNTSVGMSAFVAHRNAEIYPEPDRYIPERWLGEAGKELGPYFIAFSAGARGCIGRNISYLEQTVTLASVLHRYDIELAKPGFEPERLESNNLHPSELPVRFRKRQAMGEKDLITT
ncbi:cytochrome protein [Hortaea werneckii]|nr:cytochrome protein [Hortaea werneckii]KAI7271942.1 cytochrome protein [Hortaea werneckii]KAI7398749.1 cytochrome protein [Hortaea werneckii]KAI7423284.1 cytochrome protein [Hortaea werneckii]KAI7441644.1 cytochrome protein [Hortaea werneckii]